MVQRRETDRESTSRRGPGLLHRLLGAVGRFMRLLVLSLIVSVAIEWIGMHWWWQEQGADHSQQMLHSEIAYLKANAPRSLLTENPAEFVRRFSRRSYQSLFVETGAIRFISWLSQPSSNSGVTRQRLARGYGAIEQHVTAAINIVQVFCARLAVLCLALPLFALIAVVGLVDGLVQRDLRRWGGGRESSYLYHYAKRSNGVFLVSACVVYLALPLSVPPLIILLPFAVFLGFSLSITASMFKKYL